MNFRRLGPTELNVSVIGLGNMSWPGCNYGETPDPDLLVDPTSIERIIQTAREVGINLFDTAEGYGRGLGETLLGNALHRLKCRQEMIVVSKVGPLFGEEQLNGRTVNLEKEHILLHCEASLRRLRTDYLDLYLLHRPDPATPIEESMAALLRLQDQGKIRFFGVSNFPNDQLGEARKFGPVAANQLPYNLLQREIDGGQRQYCQEHQVGIMAYTPLGKGILTGKYHEGNLPPEEDYRHQRIYFAKENLPRHFAVTRRCRELAADLGITVTQLALAWCLSRPGITVALPGPKNPDQVRDVAAAGSINLPETVLEELTDSPRRS